MANLRFEKINKIYDNGFHAVHDFDLEIKDGEFIIFVGPSGCGKSTMLRTIAGLEEISRGRMYFDDVLVNSLSPRDRGIAMVFQSYALYPHLNVYENMSFGLTLEGYDAEYIEKRVKETAKILGLSQLLDRHPRQLSGGQCQRVAVGRAIIRKPKVFLMDEPLSNLDAKQRASMRSEIIEIHRKTRATTIYVTHDQVEAMTMADRIVVMSDGVIQQVGTPHELYFKPFNKFVAGFMGEPPMNFVSARHNSTETEFLDGFIKFDLKSGHATDLSEYEGKEILLGFRPEAARLDLKTEGIKLNGVVEVSELLGDSANLYVNMGENKIILKVQPNEIVKDDTKIEFIVPYKDIYIFDSETKKAVY